MARINIEDDVEAQDEFWRLLPLVNGDRDAALGKLVRFFRLAQRAFGKGVVLTEAELNEAGLGIMIQSGWAVPNGDGYQTRGAEKHFAWYAQKVDAGKKGGRPKKPVNLPDTPVNREEPGANRPVSAVNPLAPAPALAPVQTTKQESIGQADGPADQELVAVNALSLPARSEARALAKAEKQNQARQKAGSFAAAYVKAYQTRFPGSRPEDLNDGKVRGQILNWIADYPLERACELIQVYFQLDTKWFGTKGYDFITFRNNLNKIGQALDTGKDPDGNGIDYRAIYESEGA